MFGRIVRQARYAIRVKTDPLSWSNKKIKMKEGEKDLRRPKDKRQIKYPVSNMKF